MTAPAKGPKPGSGRKPGLEEGFSPIDEEGFGGTQGLEPDPIDAAAHENPWATGDPDPLGAPATAAWPAEEHPWTQPPPENPWATGHPDPLGAPADNSWTPSSDKTPISVSMAEMKKSLEKLSEEDHDQLMVKASGISQRYNHYPPVIGNDSDAVARRAQASEGQLRVAYALHRQGRDAATTLARELGAARGVLVYEGRLGGAWEKGVLVEAKKLFTGSAETNLTEDEYNAIRTALDIASERMKQNDGKPKLLHLGLGVGNPTSTLPTVTNPSVPKDITAEQSKAQANPAYLQEARRQGFHVVALNFNNPESNANEEVGAASPIWVPARFPVGGLPKGTRDDDKHTERRLLKLAESANNVVVLNAISNMNYSGLQDFLPAKRSWYIQGAYPGRDNSEIYFRSRKDKYLAQDKLEFERIQLRDLFWN